MAKGQLHSPEKLADHLIALGNALKDPDVKITKLATMASKCGVRLDFKFQAPQSEEQLAAIAISKHKTGDSISDEELDAGISVLKKTISAVRLFGQSYQLFVADMIRILHSFEGFAESRRRDG
jgi:hypothetical protein